MGPSDICGIVFCYYSSTCLAVRQIQGVENNRSASDVRVALYNRVRTTRIRQFRVRERQYIHSKHDLHLLHAVSAFLTAVEEPITDQFSDLSLSWPTTMFLDGSSTMSHTTRLSILAVP
jgi:hypothetical protein